MQSRELEEKIYDESSRQYKLRYWQVVNRAYKEAFKNNRLGKCQEEVIMLAQEILNEHI